MRGAFFEKVPGVVGGNASADVEPLREFVKRLDRSILVSRPEHDDVPAKEAVVFV
jgi:hypothetical protein